MNLWLSANIGNIIVLLIVVVCLFLVLKKLYKNMKSGKSTCGCSSGCGCGCDGCKSNKSDR